MSKANTSAKKQHNTELKKLEKLVQKQSEKQRQIKDLINRKENTNNNNTESLIILSLSLIGGIFISKYIL